MSHTHSPADALRAALVAGGVCVLPSSAVPPAVPVWPGYVGSLPDAPDNAICIYDTTGTKNGRLMEGRTILHPGWQIRIRGAYNQVAWGKVREVQVYLDTIVRQTVTVAGEIYRIESVTQTGSPLALGQEPDKARRETVTINGTLTIEEIDP